MEANYVRQTKAIANDSTRATTSSLDIYHYGCPRHSELVEKYKSALKQAQGNNPPCVVFYHVPKAGGSTTRRAMERIMWSRLGHPNYQLAMGSSTFKPNRAPYMKVAPYYEKNQLESVLKHFTNDTENAAFIKTENVLSLMGHNGYGSHLLLEDRGLIPKKCLTMTVFRDPTARSISAYYFHDKHKLLGTNLTEFSRCLLLNATYDMMDNNDTTTNPYRNCHQYGNHATSLFSGKWQCVRDQLVHQSGTTCEREGVAHIVNGQVTFSNGKPGRAELEAAKRNLCTMDLIGQLANLTETLSFAAALIMGKKTSEYYSGREHEKGLWNVGHEKYKKGDLTSNHFNIIETATRLDQELFLFSQKIFRVQQEALNVAVKESKQVMNVQPS